MLLTLFKLDFFEKNGGWLTIKICMSSNGEKYPLPWLMRKSYEVFPVLGHR